LGGGDLDGFCALFFRGMQDEAATSEPWPGRVLCGATEVPERGHTRHRGRHPGSPRLVLKSEGRYLCR